MHMLPDAIFQALTIATNLVVLTLGGFYIYKLKKKEQELDRKENKTDTNYHQIVNDALSKERQILEDAVSEADSIVSQAKYIKQSSKEAIDRALEELIKQVQKESIDTATGFMNSYANHIKQLSATSLNDFQNVALSLEGDLQKQLKDFREKMLPDLEKDLEEYKKMRLEQTEELITKIVQKTSQEVFNKSLPLDDHQKLLIDSLEKAKAEGVFE